MSARVGVDCKLYYNSNTLISPTWVLIPLARDVTLNLEMSEADAASRLSIMKAILVAMLTVSVEFDLIYDTTDATWAVVLTNFLARSAVEFAMMDGPIATTGSQGMRTLCNITKFSRNEKLEDTVTNSVTLKPTYGSAPTWFAVP